MFQYSEASIKFIRGSSRWEIITESILFNSQNIRADAMQHSCMIFMQLRKSFCTKDTKFCFVSQSNSCYILYLKIISKRVPQSTLDGIQHFVHTPLMFAFRYNQDQCWKQKFEDGVKKTIGKKEKKTHKQWVKPQQNQVRAVCCFRIHNTGRQRAFHNS